MRIWTPNIVDTRLKQKNQKQCEEFSLIFGEGDAITEVPDILNIYKLIVKIYYLQHGILIYLIFQPLKLIQIPKVTHPCHKHKQTKQTSCQQDVCKQNHRSCFKDTIDANHTDDSFFADRFHNSLFQSLTHLSFQTAFIIVQLKKQANTKLSALH